MGGIKKRHQYLQGLVADGIKERTGIGVMNSFAGSLFIR